MRLAEPFFHRVYMLVTMIDVSIVSCERLLFAIPFIYYTAYDAYRTHTKEIIRLRKKKHSTGNYGAFETETEGSAISVEIF